MSEGVSIRRTGGGPLEAQSRTGSKSLARYRQLGRMEPCRAGCCRTREISNHSLPQGSVGGDPIALGKPRTRRGQSRFTVTGGRRTSPVSSIVNPPIRSSTTRCHRDLRGRVPGPDVEGDFTFRRRRRPSNTVGAAHRPRLNAFRRRA